jgi:hypothetical protein
VTSGIFTAGAAGFWVVAGFTAGALPVCLVEEETLPGLLALPAESTRGFGITELVEV